MIGFLRGEVLEHSDGKAVVLVSGVGYAVSIPQGASYLSFTAGKTVELHIHTHVREDSLDLFGFASRSEKEIFLTLLTVNGIGPKVAMGILSKVETGELIRAVVEEDKDALTQIPGIGKKTAERVVMELGDKLRKKLESGEIGAIQPQRSRKDTASVTKRPADPRDAAFFDAKDALVSLGYREQEVAFLLQQVLNESEKSPADAEEWVKAALRQLTTRGRASLANT